MGNLLGGWAGSNFWDGGARIAYSFLAGLFIYRANWILKNNLGFLGMAKERLATLLVTIDKTILTLKGERAMLTNEELYEGFPKGDVYRKEAVEKYGNQVVEESEEKLRRMGNPDFTKLKADQYEIARTLAAMLHLDPASEAVQQQIARHYANIRGFWGESVCQSRNMADAYKGLAQLYVDDPRYTSRKGQANPEYAAFLHKAMVYFAERL